MMVLTYYCYSWSHFVQVCRWLLAVVCRCWRSLSALFLLSICLLCRNKSRFFVVVVCETGASISWEGRGARTRCQHHCTSRHLNWKCLLIDSWLLFSIVCSRCRLFTIVDVDFSISIVSGIHSVMGSDHLILFLSFHRDTVWCGRAIENKTFWPEKSIDTPSRWI